jgi:hypothetical protein
LEVVELAADDDGLLDVVGALPGLGADLVAGRPPQRLPGPLR